MSEEQKKDIQNGIEVTAGGIIYNEKGKIFLMRSKKWKDKLVIPGGHIEKDESFINAFKREIKEETNLDLENIQPIDFSEAINSERFHRPAHFIHLHFSAKAKNPDQVKLNGEGQEFIWLTPEEALAGKDLVCPEVIESYQRQRDCSTVKAGEYLNNWKRALADYDNLKKEVAKEREEIGRFAQAMAAMRFVEVYENLKKAFRVDNMNVPTAVEAAKDTNEQWEAWKQGIEHIIKQFVDVLKQMGIEEIKTVGEKFNPVWHEAVGEETAEGSEAGTIVREVEGGYKMGEKVLKAAKVIVT